MPHLLVERALALIPDSEEFVPLSDALISTSKVDRDKVWAGSSAYTTVGKRVVNASVLVEAIPRITERIQQRLEKLFTLILTAIQQQEAGELASAAETLVQAGEMEEADRRLEKAERIYTMALEIARDLRDKRPQILALRRLGRVTRAAGRLDEAWSWYQQSYQLSVDEMDRPGHVIACQGLGNLCFEWGQRDLARNWYEQGLQLADGLNDPKLEWPFYVNLSDVATREGDLPEAERFLERARACIDASRDEGSIFYWYNNRGVLLLERDNPVVAESTFREGLGLGPNPFWEMLISLNLGESLLKQHRLFEAEEQARKAEELAIINRQVPYLVDVYALFGRIARARCDEEGLVFYEQALSVCRERGLPRVKEAMVYYEYGLLYKSCGRPTEAVAYLERARDIYAQLGLTVELGRVVRDLEDLDTPVTTPIPA
jgi:tetratricopeptide (TPR) repeat protein